MGLCTAACGFDVRGWRVGVENVGGYGILWLRGLARGAGQEMAGECREGCGVAKVDFSFHMLMEVWFVSPLSVWQRCLPMSLWCRVVAKQIHYVLGLRGIHPSTTGVWLPSGAAADVL